LEKGAFELEGTVNIVIPTHTGTFTIDEKEITYRPKNGGMGYALDFDSLVAELMLNGEAKKAEERIAEQQERIAEQQERELVLERVKNNMRSSLHYIPYWPLWKLQAIQTVLDLKY
jgi:hypothetical protein